MKVKICANTSIEESQMCIDAEADIKMKMIRKIEKKYEDLLPMLKMWISQKLIIKTKKCITQ